MGANLEGEEIDRGNKEEDIRIKTTIEIMKVEAVIIEMEAVIIEVEIVEIDKAAEIETAEATTGEEIMMSKARGEEIIVEEEEMSALEAEAEATLETITTIEITKDQLKFNK